MITKEGASADVAMGESSASAAPTAFPPPPSSGLGSSDAQPMDESNEGGAEGGGEGGADEDD